MQIKNIALGVGKIETSAIIKDLKYGGGKERSRYGVFYVSVCQSDLCTNQMDSGEQLQCQCKQSKAAAPITVGMIDIVFC